ncbi:hypothetical protein LCGC14_0908040 [marine sediment metagenome]|uniref:Uncharacterized protein n=1 Tax=marine sediment metagenome TaxID=412755 RepID=A0A0F9PF58_9ZZZZ
MGKNTRNYLNQWIIKSSNHIELTLFNLDRIHNAVTSKGEYPEIVLTIRASILSQLDSKDNLIKIQKLLNDPRANKIGG